MLDLIQNQLTGLNAYSTRMQIWKDAQENRHPSISSAPRPIDLSGALDERIKGDDQSANSCPNVKTAPVARTYWTREGVFSTESVLNVSISEKNVFVGIGRDYASQNGKVRFFFVNDARSGNVMIYTCYEDFVIDVNASRFLIDGTSRIWNSDQHSMSMKAGEASVKDKAVVWAALVDVSNILRTMNSKEARYCAIAQSNGTVNASDVEQTAGRHFDGRAVSDLNSRVLTIMSMIQVEALE